MFLQSRFLSILLVLGLWAPGAGFTADWPQWRGPGRDGVAPGVTLPAEWPESLKTIWKVEVGEGYSSPAVVDGRVFLLVRRGDDEVLLGLDASSGRELWRDSWPAPFTPEKVAARHGKGPFSSPTVADGRVYTCGISNILSCHEASTGKRVWWKHFKEGHKKPHPMWGAANSPLIEGDLCIVCVGTENDEGGLAGLDRDTGEIVWTLTADGPGYASPFLAELAGKRQIVMLLQESVIGADAGTGKLLWKFPFKVPYMQNAVTPVTAGDLVVVSGFRSGALAVRIRAEGGELTPEKVWANEQGSMYMSSPILHGEHLYGLVQKDRGSLACLSIGDGDFAWTSTGGWGEYASIVRAGDKLLVLTTDGSLVVVAADPADYREVGRSQITEEPVWAHLAVTSERIYIKDKTHLHCVELPGAAETPERGIHGLSVTDIDGKPLALSRYRGKAVLFVNVASECGYTPQYAGLQKLYSKYREKGFVLVGVPSNDFGRQEPGTEAEIKQFCSSKFGVTFPMLSKVSVKNGREQCELYEYLTSKSKNGALDAKISWNFNKILVGKDGVPIRHYPSKVTPLDEGLGGDIEAALGR